MLPRLSSTFVSRWILVTLAASLLCALGAGWLGHLLALAPARVIRGELWRLVTWPVIELGPISLVVTCLAIYKFGSDLAVRWGDRRLQRYVLEIVIAAGVITCLLALVTGMTYIYRLGGWAVSDALVIAWARQFPERTLVVYGMITLRGREIIGITLGTTIIIALYQGVIVSAPDLVACAAAAWYPTARLRG